MPYFTTDELRALPDVQDPGRFSDDRLAAARDWIVGIVERECDTSFIPSVVTENVNGSGVDALFLSSPYIQSVEAVTVDGTDYTTDQVDALLIQNGALYDPTGAYWSYASRGNVTVTYTAGYSTEPPPDLKEAMMRAARNWLLTSDAWSGKDSRATSISNDGGTISLVIAGPDRPTGYPDVDATIMAWARRVRVPKVS